MQRDADDLARTAQTIPSGVANIRKGMLPKDVIEKEADRKAVEAIADAAKPVSANDAEPQGEFYFLF